MRLLTALLTVPVRLLAAPTRLFTWLWENHAKRTVGAILLLVVLSAAASGYANIALGQANARNAVTNCENANESRQASKTLWDFVINLAAKSAPPDRVAYLGEVREWIAKVYQPHDCGQLDRPYPLPDPPKLPATT